MHNIENRLGALVKAARLNRGLTQEQLAEKIGIGLRHIMGIENEAKSPSYEVLYSLIRELNLSADSIFYPETRNEDSKLQYLVRLLGQCSERDMQAVIALTEAFLAAPGKE